MANDHTLSRELATTQRAGPHEDPLTASSGRPSEERVTGHQEGSQGLISPSRRMFSTAPVREGFILLVPTRFTEVHIRSTVSSMSLRAKDHLEGTKVAVFPRYCAENKVQTGSAADWRPPKSGDQEDDKRPGYPKRSRRPRETS